MSNQHDGASPPPNALPESKSIPELVPPALDGVLEAAGVDLKNPQVTKALEISMSFMVARGSLPLPPAEILAEYEREFPGLGQKLIGWTEQQRGHRQSLERQRAEGSEPRMDRGQLIAASVAITGLLVGGAVGIFGSAWAAGIIAIVAIGGPTAAIWLASTMNHKNQLPPSATPSKQPDAPKPF
jgi:uncharacterized membrane protein